jgi:hypothetical protein
MAVLSRDSSGPPLRARRPGAPAETKVPPEAGGRAPGASEFCKHSCTVVPHPALHAGPPGDFLQFSDMQAQAW